MDWKAILSVTLILFSIIDILGNIPIILSLKEKGLKIEAFKATVASAIIMIGFLFIGEHLLGLFGVDINSFAIAGGIVIFIIGLEMILGHDFFNNVEDEAKKASVFPIAFPLIAGAGTLTTILSLKAEFENSSIIAGIVINLVVIYAVIKSSTWLQNNLGRQGTAVLRKVFGIILLAIAIKLIKTNW
jgi:multiple antibiotic resistance protein